MTTKALTILLALTLFACSDKEQAPDPNLDCSCGRVGSIEEVGNVGGFTEYSYDIINDCTGNSREFTALYLYDIGDRFCFAGENW